MLKAAVIRIIYIVQSESLRTCELRNTKDNYSNKRKTSF